jgi:DNA primase
LEDLKEKLIDYLEINNLKWRDSGQKIQHCCLNPEHIENNPSAFTKIEGTESFTHCSTCGYHLNYERLIKFLGGTLDTNLIFKSKMNKLFEQLKEKEALSLQPKEDNIVILPPKDKPFKATYRGISSKTFEKVDAYITNEQNYYRKRIIFPIYNRKNELISFEAISFDSEVLPKVLRPKNIDTTTLFGFENKILNNDFKRNDIVFICEGLFSSLSFIEIGYKGVFNFGVGSIENKLEVLYQNGVKYVVLAGDFDTAGRKFNSECYHLLKNSFKVIFFKFPWKESKEKFDSNDLIKLDLLEKSVENTIKNLI